MEKLFIRGERPTIDGNGNKLHYNWAVYEAPRPIYGSSGRWYGWDGRGWHFAAIDPADKFAGQLTEGNRQMQAREVEWVSETQIQEYITVELLPAIAEALGDVEEAKEYVTNASSAEIWDNYIRAHS